jgi:hypothetical protein
MIGMKLHKAGAGALALLFAFAYAPVSSAALSYSQDWESRTAGETTGVQDGWVIGNVNVTTGGEWFVGFAAPTGVNAWADFVSEGGPSQGNTQLSAYTDYNNSALPDGDNVIGYLYRDLGLVTSDMVGNTYSFSFDAKLGNIVSGPNPTGDANAYVNILKSSDTSFDELFNDVFNWTGLPGDGSWGGGSIEVTILPEFEGELLQIGFSHEVTGFMDTGIIYDNLNFDAAVIPVPAAVWLFGSGLLGLVGVARRRKAQS